jgi:hypothetical protein
MTDLTDFQDVAVSAEPAEPQPPAPEGSTAAEQFPPVPEESAAEQLQARIEELTQERDQARQELGQARQELELAHRAQPRAVGPDHPNRCSVCLKQRNAVKAMFASPRRHHQFSLCNECIDEMYQVSNEFIAKGNPSITSGALDASRCRHDKALEPQQGRGNDHHAESFWMQDARSAGPAQTEETRP